MEKINSLRNDYMRNEDAQKILDLIFLNKLEGVSFYTWSETDLKVYLSHQAC